MFRKSERQKVVAALSIAMEIDDDSLAQAWTRRLERQTAARLGRPIDEVREQVAREVGGATTAGMIRNVSEGRTKGVRSWLFRRLRARVIADLQHELKALTHELEVAHLAGLDVDLRAVAEVEADLERVREALARLVPAPLAARAPAGAVRSPEAVSRG
ncbi:hypothetical protein Mnod_3571 [Methylobacterium nodulans ORS 2060]|uniref:Uncharacterized protein n=2 Tax=Methylobacterium nodulans TaxID=114616 RepID=B8INW4_METNO|nr:hypothetical protein Mnod_3571 [Methylobacterium nodulans ORS 2060]